MTLTKKANGYAIYGNSLLTGKPYKTVITGTRTPSQNVKTADMLQVTIMPLASKPSEAVRNGDDESVCGQCPKRPLLVNLAKKRIAEANVGLTKKAIALIQKESVNAPCYVETAKAPNGIYKTEYPTTPTGRNVPVRFGAWGDPAAMDLPTLQSILKQGNGKHTGYTHQWNNPNIDPNIKQLLMASVDNVQQAKDAQAKGWRTFRVRKATEPILENEVACPASKEGGKRTTCNRCGLCSGTSRTAKNIVIIEH